MYNYPIETHKGNQMTNPTKQEILALFETDIETRKKKIVEFFQDTNNSLEEYTFKSTNRTWVGDSSD